MTSPKSVTPVISSDVTLEKAVCEKFGFEEKLASGLTAVLSDEQALILSAWLGLNGCKPLRFTAIAKLEKIAASPQRIRAEHKAAVSLLRREMKNRRRLQPNFLDQLFNQ